ncbi:MAG TPA: ATP-binding protein [Candidatus Acidoferrales bacterium]|nr:ATP-binding protein [Terriglobia bacterium]
MTFRTKLFALFMLALLISVGAVAVGVTILARRALDESNRQHSEALLGQFQREFERRGQDVAHQVQAIADAEATVRMAIDLSRPQADVSVYVNDARGVSQAHQLDFLDFVSDDGSIISSNEWPSHFGNKMDWLVQPQDWATRGAFLARVDTQDGPALGLMSVSKVRVGDKDLYIFGGARVGKDFLSSLVLPTGMRALLYLNLDPSFQTENLVAESGPVLQGERLAAAIEQQRRHPGRQTFRIVWTPDAASAETFQAMPLLGRQGEVLSVLLVGSSQRESAEVQRRLLLLATLVAASGLVFGLLLGWWGAAAVTRPVKRLETCAWEVSEGKFNTRANVSGSAEIGRLALAFNHMSEQLGEQRDRLVQTERAASWRELARRLADELRNPLVALQTAAESFQRGQEQNPEQSNETSRTQAAQLLSGIEELETIVSKFRDFGGLPQPELASVDLNDVVRGTVKQHEGEFGAVGRPPITPELHLEENLPLIQADASLLRRALDNLVLNAMDAMPGGGVLMLRTNHANDAVELEISDTGTGLTPQECGRLFTPYYTTKQHGTGLGLAVVQSVVSDHGGRIWVESEAGVGTSFHVRLPAKPPQRATKQPTPPIVRETVPAGPQSG